MAKLTEWMDQSLYPQFGDNWDDTWFREILLEKLKPEHHWLDYGAGRGYVAQMNFKGKVAFMAGVDPGQEVLETPYLNDAKVLDLTENIIPYEDNVFDVVFSDNVMEHVQNPGVVFREVSRVLKVGGHFISKTPSKLHYVPFFARLTPTAFHRYYNRLRGREAVDTFPTVYGCNTRAAVKKYAVESGFKVNRVDFAEGRPEYLRLAAVTYLLGYSYERIVNSSGAFAPYRAVMMFELQKTN